MTEEVIGDRAEVAAAARELLDQTRRSIEGEVLERARQGGYTDAFFRLKRGLKGEAFLGTPVGKMFVEKCRETIADACEIWVVSDDPEAVRVALANARAAHMALSVFARILDDIPDAQRQLDQIEDEVGISDE